MRSQGYLGCLQTQVDSTIQQMTTIPLVFGFGKSTMGTRAKCLIREKNYCAA